MVEQLENPSSLLPPSDPPESQPKPQPPPSDPIPIPSSQPSDPATTPPPRTGFNPSRSKLIGIIRRKAMIKDLAAIYHAECLAYCQELLELQKKVEESLINAKPAEDSRRETMRPPKRMKKAR
ncbi:uncharacterized protein LOC107800346 isoform X1 [Nicotiana tabacum]|uniref:Mediator of RNA polymerase II transcription subunit 15 isoform X1 n=2 Tax=Nicotiana TaxID=4085 RepID=A0A1S4AQY0_TOBAC|nr:PREDICTED: acrosin isoform X1 [Nicotiana sylvestris]XP_009787373.1 PREDICTED: acrosin isoform X1 [Nicotiana sylvestris]XP_016478991.1 PREDICTED: mediator of RNA polymerase II transcription subunit 15-like isoform X1 [Nicotiana tabacum]XP_016478997.1 PREDICTED: mediator of RNA polymerase II transcription subunit 15-like isoform X1 [Nicotiana tabacum]